MKHEPFNESVEMYLKTASELAVGDGPVPISALADRLGVSAVSATEMVHRLCDQGLLDHTPYKGVTLTCRRRPARPPHHPAPPACGNVSWPTIWVCPGKTCTTTPARWNTPPRDEVDGGARRFSGSAGRPARTAIPFPDRRRNAGTRRRARSTSGRRATRGAITRLHPESLLLLDYAASQNIRPGQAVESAKGLAPFAARMMMRIGGVSPGAGSEVAAHIFGIRNHE